jgi:hypothetical protein
VAPTVVAGETRATSVERGIVGSPVPNALAVPSPKPAPRPAETITGALVVCRAPCGLTVDGRWTVMLEGVGTTTGVLTGVTFGVVVTGLAGVVLTGLAGAWEIDGVDSVNVGVPVLDDDEVPGARPVLP